MVMFNPEILKKSDPYRTEEGCLSLTGLRPVKRWKSIKVRWQNEQFQERIKTFTGWTAQIIQHEIDHCEGQEQFDCGMIKVEVLHNGRVYKSSGDMTKGITVNL